MRRTMSWALYMGSFWPLMTLAGGASLALVLWFGGRDVVGGRLTHRRVRAVHRLPDDPD